MSTRQTRGFHQWRYIQGEVVITRACFVLCSLAMIVLAGARRLPSISIVLANSLWRWIALYRSWENISCFVIIMMGAITQ